MVWLYVPKGVGKRAANQNSGVWGVTTWHGKLQFWSGLAQARAPLPRLHPDDPLSRQPGLHVPASSQARKRLCNKHNVVTVVSPPESHCLLRNITSLQSASRFAHK
ncbi:hypothetical protein IG631_14033 [Alternaria alternata]|nr:hypothetical protein IG631_14033 [Alternaria alternata]